MGKLYERLMSVFLDEARVRLEEMRSALECISSGTDDREILETLRRGAHTLKGNAAAMEFHPVSRLAAALERAAAATRDQPGSVGAGAVTVFREALDALASLVDRLAGGSFAVGPVDAALVVRLEEVRRSALSLSDGV